MLRVFGVMVFGLGSLSAALHAQPGQRSEDHEEDRRALTYRLFRAAVGDRIDPAPSMQAARLSDFAFARACVQTLQKAAELLPLHPIGPDEDDPETFRNLYFQYANDDIRRYAKAVEADLPPPDADEVAGRRYRFTPDVAAMPDAGLGQPKGPQSLVPLIEVGFRDMIDTQCREGAPVS